MSNPGDPTKQPPECASVFTPFTAEFPRDPMQDAPNATGRWSRCPHLKYQNDMIMDGDTYDCGVCGKYYKLYYDDMA